MLGLAVESKIVEIVRDVGRKRGLDVREQGQEILLSHRSAPIHIRVRKTSGGLEVSLGCENIRDFIEDIKESEEDPRDFIESLLDDLTFIAYELRNRLEREGYKVVFRVREVVMDILDQLEESVEEGL